MPQLPAMIVTALSTVGITVTTEAVSMFLVTQAVSLLSLALTPKPEIQNGYIKTQTADNGADRPRTFILGYCPTYGNNLTEKYVFDIDKDDAKFLMQIVGVSDYPIEGIDGYVFDNSYMKLRPQGSGNHIDDQLG